jgi:hypothetical protein
MLRGVQRAQQDVHCADKGAGYAYFRAMLLLLAACKSNVHPGNEQPALQLWCCACRWRLTSSSEGL